MPVTFPPGRASLLIRPRWTASASAGHRNDGRRSVCRNRSINSGSYNHVRFEINDLLRKCWQPIPKALRVTRHHVEVSAIDVIQVPHAIEKDIGSKASYLGW